MDRWGVTDIRQELVDQFAKESFLCFFTFQIALPDKASVSGLCKVARPKRGTSALNYLSVLFVIDVPDNEHRGQIESIVKRLEEGRFRQALPELKSIISIPAMEFDAGIYLKQLDLILHAQDVPDEHFIADRVYPAILEAGRFDADEMIWWDDLAELKATSPGGVILQKTRDVSLGEKLKRMFGVKHD